MMRPKNLLAAGLAIAGVATYLLPMAAARGDDAAPTYQNGVLSLPSVSTAAQVGQYQDAVLQLDGNGAWRLTSLKALGGDILVRDAMIYDTLYQVPLSRVEVVKTTDAPAQVFLRVYGNLTGCASLGRVTQRLVGNRFEVFLADGTSGLTYAVASCTADVRPYIKTIPLSVYGLSAGTYSYAINGTTGSFALTADNALPGDCLGSSACQD